MITAGQQFALLAGAVSGAGLFLVIRALWPRTAQLVPTVNALTGHPSDDVGANVAGELAGSDGTWSSRIGVVVLRRWPSPPGLNVPYRDLALLGVPVSRYLGERIAYAAGGWLVGAAASVLSGLGPLAIVGGAAVIGPGLAFGASLLPHQAITRAAGRAREDFKVGLSTYADLVALQVASGVGTTQALETAATLGDSWVFTRLGEELRRADFTQTPPWEALREVADELELPRLTDVADILRLSVESSVTIGEHLQTRAHELRNELLNNEHERANMASERLNGPLSLLVLAFLGLLVGPALLELF